MYFYERSENFQWNDMFYVQSWHNILMDVIMDLFQMSRCLPCDFSQACDLHHNITDWAQQQPFLFYLSRDSSGLHRYHVFMWADLSSVLHHQQARLQKNVFSGRQKFCASLISFWCLNWRKALKKKKWLAYGEMSYFGSIVFKWTVISFTSNKNSVTKEECCCKVYKVATDFALFARDKCYLRISGHL